MSTVREQAIEAGARAVRLCWVRRRDGAVDIATGVLDAAEPIIRADAFRELSAWVGDHQYDYTEWDTGVSKCRHPDHRSGYSAVCPKASVRRDLLDGTR